MMKKGLLAMTVLALMSATSFGQDKPADKQKAGKQKYNRISIGAHGGYTLFYGDIRQYNHWPSSENVERWNFAGGGFVAYQFHPVWGVNVNVMGGTLGGVKRLRANSDAANANIAPTQHRNVKFRNNFIDYTLNFQVNWTNLLYSDKTKQRRFTSYLTAGVGFISFRTFKNGLYNDEFMFAYGYEHPATGTPTTASDATKTSMTTETIVPVGMGVKFRISRRFDLFGEYTHRFTFSDKLDATTVTGSADDSYSYAALGLTFKIGKHKESTEWVNPFQALNSKLNDIETNIEGLTVDSDGDGVSDLFDKEADTPADVAVDGSGRAIDVDADGVPDYLDADPFTPKGARVDESGRELDSDGDGVADSQDLEPNTAAGALVNFQGKTITPELIGVDEAAAGAGSMKGGMNLMSIYFKVNSSRIDFWSSFDKLAEVAKLMKANTGVNVKVVGHADRTGAEDYNKTLAEKRAQAAVDHLVKVYGLDAGRFSVESAGQSEPLSKTDDALNVNRRVDFIVK
jgi:outer membrane protein OmpA-like peptidoglycan-associated protein